ncbi:MAG: hypothetical protein JWN74_2721 [Acidobacteriaceae bacterium]|nr:hypothetical protein [Acidobacteriaceae bacterium]
MNSKSKTFLALVLAIAVAATGCSAQWINIALQDLPVLTQMALNIATLVSAVASGQQASRPALQISRSFKTSRRKPAGT